MRRLHALMAFTLLPFSHILRCYFFFGTFTKYRFPQGGTSIPMLFIETHGSIESLILNGRVQRSY